LGVWYEANEEDVPEFEKQMRRKVHYVIKPQHLWSNITELARQQKGELLQTVEEGFRYIENVRKRIRENGGNVGKIYGQEKNITTYNLAPMNMLLHGMKDTEFEIFYGDTLLNQ